MPHYVLTTRQNKARKLVGGMPLKWVDHVGPAQPRFEATKAEIKAVDAFLKKNDLGKAGEFSEAELESFARSKRADFRKVAADHGVVAKAAAKGGKRRKTRKAKSGNADALMEMLDGMSKADVIALLSAKLGEDD